MSKLTFSLIKKAPDPLPDEGPVVVFFHGFGADADDIIGIGEGWILTREIKGNLPLAFLAPEAAQLTPVGYGKQWFPLPDLSVGVLQEGIQHTSPLIAKELLTVLSEKELENRPLFLGGFSQGAMLALDLACQGLVKVEGVLSYSGMLLRTPLVEPNFPVFLYHGTSDTIVPARASDLAKETLEHRDFRVESIFAPGVYHQIDQAGCEEGLHFIYNTLKKVN